MRRRLRAYPNDLLSMEEKRSRFRTDLASALPQVLGVAIALALLVALRDRAFAAAGNPRGGSSTEAVIAIYLICGLFVGVAVAAVRPLLTSLPGRAVLGVLISWPCTLLFEYVANNPAEDFIDKIRDATTLALLYGIGGAMVFGRFSRESPDRERHR